MKNFKVSRAIYNKRFFDADSLEDLRLAKEFLKTGQWPAGCPFALDWPYTNMPDLIKTEIVKRHIDGIIAEKTSKKYLVKK